VATLAALAAIAGCGRKGPPLAPLVRVPAAVTTIEARRLGSDVFVTFTLPVQNADASEPADLARVELLALTAPEAPPPAQFRKLATRIASLAVHPPPAKDAEPNEPAPGAIQQGAIQQGATVTIREPLRPEMLRTDDRESKPLAKDDVSDADGKPAGPLRRFYMVVPSSARGRAATGGMVVSVPVAAPPAAPDALAATNTADATTLSWKPAPGAAGYNVYRAAAEPGPQPGAPSPESRAPSPELPVPSPGDPPTAAVSQAPVPLNDALLAEPSFSEPVAFGEVRCFEVRVVAEADGIRVEGDAASRCHTAEDRFPPATPTSLTALPVDEGIRLRWRGGNEPDLAGYLVLRGRAGDATLQPVTPVPIAEVEFLDRSVTSGTRYVYAVVAVDVRGNRSGESDRDDETAR
jgi:hypothetical protein